MKVKRPVILISLGILISVAVDLYAAEIYDIMGRHILTTETDMASIQSGSAVVSIGNYNTLHDNAFNLASGLYFINTDPVKSSAFNSIGLTTSRADWIIPAGSPSFSAMSSAFDRPGRPIVR